MFSWLIELGKLDAPSFMDDYFALLAAFLRSLCVNGYHVLVVQPQSIHDLNNGEDEGAGKVTTASFIGILVAISGNILISLALNCQKLAHRRLEREREANHCKDQRCTTPAKGRRGLLSQRRLSITSDDSIREEAEVERGDGEAVAEAGVDGGERSMHAEVSHSHPNNTNNDACGDRGEAFPFPAQEMPTRPRRTFRDRAHTLLLETEPLLIVASGGAAPLDSLRREYGSHSGGSAAVNGSWRARSRSSPGLLSRLLPPRGKREARTSPPRLDIEAAAVPIDIYINGEGDRSPANGHGNGQRTKVKFVESKASESENIEANESDYLKSRLWWFGFLLMNVGEMGNFISYAFAPASVVAPLGTFALIANCLFAPLMLKEKFRSRDLFGVGLAILGAVTVVLSANPSDTRLDPSGLIQAISQNAFIVLAVLYVIGAAALVSLSSQRLGNEHVFIDVGACALFGGFTVLSTKAISSLITLEWAAVFKEWIAYPTLAVLVGTGVGQIKYLNRALMKFDSKIVIPTQFVLFNLSAIIGSAVLYGDFRKATLHQMVTFLYGVAATFAGVFVLTWAPNVERGAGDTGVGQDRHDDRERAERTGHAQLVLPSTPTRPAPILRARTSSLGLGLSPARVLLVRTPTTEDVVT